MPVQSNMPKSKRGKPRSPKGSPTKKGKYESRMDNVDDYIDESMSNPSNLLNQPLDKETDEQMHEISA